MDSKQTGQRQIQDTHTQTNSQVKVEMVAYNSYSEMSENPVQQTDHLQRLHSNIALLEDMQNRLSFISKEIRYHIKR